MELKKLIDANKEKLEGYLSDDRTKLKNYISGDERVEKPVVDAINELIRLEENKNLMGKDELQKKKNSIIENVKKESKKGIGNRIKSVYLEDKNIQAEKILNVRGGYAISDKIMYQEVVQAPDGKYYFVPHYINGNCGKRPKDMKVLFRVYKNTLIKVENRKDGEFLCTYLTNDSGNVIRVLMINEIPDKNNRKPITTTACKKISLVKLSKLGRVIKDNGLS